ncbi:hypothetical protein ABH927_004826 [Planotetraspora sp. GP83]
MAPCSIPVIHRCDSAVRGIGPPPKEPTPEHENPPSLAALLAGVLTMTWKEI